ncbi:MAG TPA: HAMP domain-containing protein [Marmoricola sp.]|nr:HAMP domain-containing protein [Marmoricola sp.]
MEHVLPHRPGRPTWPSLESRLALLTTVAVGLAVAVVALVAYTTVRAQSIGALDDSLRTRAQAIADAGEAAVDEVVHHVDQGAFSAADVRVSFLYADGLQFDGDALLPPLHRELSLARGHGGWSARTLVVGGTRVRVVAVPAGPGRAVAVVESLAGTDRMLTRLGLVMLLFGLLGVGLAATAGWAVARHGLRPVRRLTAAAEEITRTGRLDPIPVTGNGEVARLALAFNAMLVALASSDRRQSEWVAAAGRELRNPMADLRAHLDRLTQDADGLSARARTELLADVRAQVEEMTAVIVDLVRA